MRHQFIYIIIFSTLGAFEYPEFDVLVNNNPYPANIFIHSTGPDCEFMAILDPDMELKWHIATIDGKGWDFKVNNNEKLTYFEKPESNEIRLWYVMDS